MKCYIKSNIDLSQYQYSLQSFAVDIIIPIEHTIKSAKQPFNRRTKDTISQLELEQYKLIKQSVMDELTGNGFTVYTKEAEHPDHLDSLTTYYTAYKLFADIKYVEILNVRVSNHFVDYKDPKDEIIKIFNRQQFSIRRGKQLARELLGLPNSSPVDIGIPDQFNYVVNALSIIDIQEIHRAFKSWVADLVDNYKDNDKFYSMKRVYDERDQKLAALRDDENPGSITSSIAINSNRILKDLDLAINDFVEMCFSEGYDFPDVDTVFRYITEMCKYLSLDTMIFVHKKPDKTYMAIQDILQDIQDELVDFDN